MVDVTRSGQRQTPVPAWWLYSGCIFNRIICIRELMMASQILWTISVHFSIEYRKVDWGNRPLKSFGCSLPFFPTCVCVYRSRARASPDRAHLAHRLEKRILHANCCWCLRSLGEFIHTLQLWHQAALYQSQSVPMVCDAGGDLPCSRTNVHSRYAPPGLEDCLLWNRKIIRYKCTAAWWRKWFIKIRK